MGESEVTDSNIKPAIDSHPYPVGCMVSTSPFHLVGADTSNQLFVLVGSSIPIGVMEDA